MEFYETDINEIIHTNIAEHLYLQIHSIHFVLISASDTKAVIQYRVRQNLLSYVLLVCVKTIESTVNLLDASESCM